MSITATFTVSNEAGWSGNITSVLNCAQAALNLWGAALAGSANIQVSVHLMTSAQLIAAGKGDSSTIAAAGPADLTYVGTTAFAGLLLEEPTFAYQLRTGVDPNGSTTDVTIYVNASRLNVSTWIDPNALTDGANASVPSGMDDLVSVFEHELFHALGFTGFRQDPSGHSDTLYGPTTYETPFDVNVGLSGIFSGYPVFSGSNASALYGGQVPLDTISCTYHVNQNISDLMDPYSTSGARIAISPLDLAFAADMGLGTIRNDFLQADAYHTIVNGGAGNDTFDYNVLVGTIGTRIYVDGGGGFDVLEPDSGNDLFGQTTMVHNSDGSWNIDFGGANSTSWHVSNVEQLKLFGRTIALREPTRSDFNGSSTSDILWRNDNGIVTDWLMTNGRYTGAGYGYAISTDWSVAGTGDFNGDGTTDILWRNTNGIVTDWLMNNGQYTGAGYGYSVSTDWKVVGTGDFNGDGTTDILWRNSTTGIVTDWLMSNGQYTGSGYGYSISTDWSVAGTGDFNGDGTTDILWRNSTTGIVTDWLMSNGQYTGSGYGYSISTDWSVAGTGDYNGDGTTDILWRNGAGTVTDWLMNNGQYTGSGYGYSVATAWHVTGGSAQTV